MFDSHAPGIGAIELLARLEPEPPSRLGVELTGGRLKTLDGPGWTLTENRRRPAASATRSRPRWTRACRGFLEKPFAEPAKRFLVTEPVEALKRRAES